MRPVFGGFLIGPKSVCSVVCVNQSNFKTSVHFSARHFVRLTFKKTEVVCVRLKLLIFIFLLLNIHKKSIPQKIFLFTILQLRRQSTFHSQTLSDVGKYFNSTCGEECTKAVDHGTENSILKHSKPQECVWVDFLICLYMVFRLVRFQEGLLVNRRGQLEAVGTTHSTKGS
jgi:hypothetical protein